MTADRPRRFHRRGRFFVSGLALAGALWSAAAVAQTGGDGSLLTGDGPRTTAVPIARPYFLGWDAEVTHPAGILRTSLEPGGVAVDPRSGWVYASTRDGRVVCLDGGVQKWEVEVGGALLAAPTVWEDSVIVGTGEGVLAVLNKVSGERRARAILGEELVTSPVVVRTKDGPVRAYVGSSQDSLFAVDLELGQKLWRAHRDQPAPFTIRGFARPVVTEKAVFAGFADGYLEALDPATGQVKWEKKLSPPGDLVDVDALATNDQLLFAASYSGGVYGLDPATGTIAWRTPMSGAGRLRVDGANVVAVAPGVVQSLRTGDGKIVWKFTFGTRMAATPAVSEHLVAVSEDDGPIYFLDSHSGAPMGLFRSGSGFDSPPAIGGRILVALSNGGRVYSMSLVR